MRNRANRRMGFKMAKEMEQSLEMLCFSLILRIRQCFIAVSVYTISGTDTPYVSPYCMFRPDVAILRYIRSHNHLFIFLLLSLLLTAT
jgi:hypothetical protein